MRYALKLTIKYEFDRPSGGGRQLLRIRPAELPGRQSVLMSRLTVHPRPLEERRFHDFFGADVEELVMPSGMTEVSYDLRARVERFSLGAAFDVSPPLDRLAAEIAQQKSLGPLSPHHFTGPSPRIPPVAPIAAFATQAVEGAATTREAVIRLGEALYHMMSFDAEATEVDTPIAKAFAGRHGVCQDFSQIMIAALRSVGVPAAYVTGFLRTIPPPGKKRLEGADAMHAWVRAWTGSESGWMEYDPTNGCLVDLDHIVVGYGRDYSDAAPVTGVIRLDSSQSGSHSVDITEI